MKIAIAKDVNQVSGHFGHCQGFEIYTVVDGNVLDNVFLENPGHRPGFLPKFLAEKGVNVIVSGGMGSTAQQLFKENGIKVIVGVQGSIDNVVQKFISGSLTSTNSVCESHAHKGSCGEHK